MPPRMMKVTLVAVSTRILHSGLVSPWKFLNDLVFVQISVLFQGKKQLAEQRCRGQVEIFWEDRAQSGDL